MIKLCLENSIVYLVVSQYACLKSTVYIDIYTSICNPDSHAVFEVRERRQNHSLLLYLPSHYFHFAMLVLWLKFPMISHRCPCWITLFLPQQFILSTGDACSSFDLTILLYPFPCHITLFFCACLHLI